MSPFHNPLRAAACCMIVAAYCFSPVHAQSSRTMSGTVASVDEAGKKVIVQVNYEFAIDEKTTVNGERVSTGLGGLKAGSKVTLTYTRGASGMRLVTSMNSAKKQAVPRAAKAAPKSKSAGAVKADKKAQGETEAAKAAAPAEKQESAKKAEPNAKTGEAVKAEKKAQGETEAAKAAAPAEKQKTAKKVEAKVKPAEGEGAQAAQPAPEKAEEAKPAAAPKE